MRAIIEATEGGYAVKLTEITILPDNSARVSFSLGSEEGGFTTFSVILSDVPLSQSAHEIALQGCQEFIRQQMTLHTLTRSLTYDLHNLSGVDSPSAG